MLYMQDREADDLTSCTRNTCQSLELDPHTWDRNELQLVVAVDNE